MKDTMITLNSNTSVTTTTRTPLGKVVLKYDNTCYTVAGSNRNDVFGFGMSYDETNPVALNAKEFVVEQLGVLSADLSILPYITGEDTRADVRRVNEIISFCNRH